jgi:DNA repair exonuclease SbcCD nuclease subunit
MQKDNLPDYVEGDILVTHIRGEVPPHVSPEYDFSRLAPWRLCLLGDLHFNHRYGDSDCYYPGSPLNTTFDRDEKRQYGVDIYDFITDKDYRRKFVDLQLPKLIRKRISAGDPMPEDTINHVVYEVTGSVDELTKIENTELLDKKIASAPDDSSKLDLKNKSTFEELEMYLDYIKIKDKSAVLSEFKELNINV